ncbi:DUF4236 domain-containing protein [Methyloligella sp. 2.7D]|uniref:DUF4236 domain-containing protein n=1 Tax=unclassified Methyloligella TaxID=2625955 RepID=UPI00157C033F|nr:DUF4236 domain-containing protein [Methyloligella sp. GL2]QKP76333.1 DUF4236 domain-containing protein [Methyloligella sp. GL2]
MPFYFRKSVAAGPFRFNFSQSGVGISVGVKGFRIGTGPRGHYVRAGLGGIYYRGSLGGAGERSKRRREAAARRRELRTVPSSVEMTEIESGDVLEMRDEKVGDLIDELNAKQQQISFAKVFGYGFALLGLAAGLLSGGAGWIIVAFALPAWVFGSWLDSYRRKVVVLYDLDTTIEARYRALTEGIDTLANCGAKWHIESHGQISNLTAWKQHAGADRLVSRKSTSLSYAKPKVLESNITPPALGVGRQVIYLLPDVVLMEDSSRFGAIAYRDLDLRIDQTNFIEDGSVPKDAEVVGYTWKHPNKRGGPDRRFKDNYQIPVCRYEQLHLTSESGVNELLIFSQLGLLESVIRSFEALSKTPLVDDARQSLAERINALEPRAASAIS